MAAAKTGVITVSFSELDTFRQCPLKWQLAYLERWSKPPRPGGALDKGITWHTTLETHYKLLAAEQHRRATGDGGKPIARRLWKSDQQLLDESVAAIQPMLFNSRSGEPLSDVHDLIWWMFCGYIKHWGLDPQWEVRAVEHGPVVPLFTPAGKLSRFRLKLKIDLLVRDHEFDGRDWIVDHKSGKDLPRDKQLDIDDQFGLYTYSMAKLGRRVFGSLHNAARTQRNKDDSEAKQPLDTRFRRTRLHRTEGELQQIAEDAYLACTAMYGRRPVSTGGTGGLGFYSSPDTDRCGWRCDFLDVHLMARKGADLRETLMGAGFEQRFERH